MPQIPTTKKSWRTNTIHVTFTSTSQIIPVFIEPCSWSDSVIPSSNNAHFKTAFWINEFTCNKFKALRLQHAVTWGTEAIPRKAETGITCFTQMLGECFRTAGTARNVCGMVEGMVKKHKSPWHVYLYYCFCFSLGAVWNAVMPLLCLPVTNLKVLENNSSSYPRLVFTKQPLEH